MQVREGKLVLTDGLFADSREKIVAYELIVECASPKEAIAVASRHPIAKAQLWR